MRRIIRFFISTTMALTLCMGCGDIEVAPAQEGCKSECATTQVCFKKQCCTPNCERPDGSQKECGPDGCGGTCGNCMPNQTCSNNGICKATP